MCTITNKRILIFLLLLMNFSLSAQSIDKIKVNYLGRMWNKGQAEASVISQDGGYSYVVPGGSLWWFGDTFKGTRDEKGMPHFEGGGVSCSAALLKKEDKNLPPVLKYLTGKDKTVEQAIQFLPGESWDHNRIWPMAGIYLNGKSYIFYSLIEITGNGEWDFKAAGSGLAYSEELLSTHKLIINKGDWHFPVSPAAIITTKEWIYFYEVDKTDGKQGVWLSRVEPDKIEDPGAYYYYCGGGNFDKGREKQIIFIKNIYGQVSVAWNDYLKQYVLVSSSDFFRAREINFYISTLPSGDFKKSSAFIKVPENLQDKKVNLVYCSYRHPELFRENGRIMNITFSLNLKDSGFDANNEMIEVELE